ncbi:MAG: iron-containing alcohol dehydrogenase [Spirochaetia bacterium]|nr:iron-containing alcohol dehydrogenase [Spirochaetia bacterium]
MTNFTLLFPPRTHFGYGAVEKLASIEEITGRTGVIITGSSWARSSGTLETVKKTLNKRADRIYVFDRVEPEVSVETVDEAAAFCRKKKASFVLGLGGGSALDCAKAAAGCAVQKHSVKEYLDKKAVLGKKPLFFIAVPSTAGTGSEVTKNAVLTYTEKGIKISLRSDNLIPRVAVLDPELTLTAGRTLTAYTGMDALTHAVESYISKNANPVTGPLSEQAIILIAGNIEKACRLPGNRGARYNMMLGSYMAGLAFANAGLGAVHGIGHPVGAVCGIPHGLVNAIMLPEVLKYNAPACAKLLQNFRKRYGFDLVMRVAALKKSLKIPAGIACVCPGARGMQEEIVKRVEYGASMSYNPVAMDEAKVREILNCVM